MLRRRVCLLRANGFTCRALLPRADQPNDAFRVLLDSVGPSICLGDRSHRLFHQDQRSIRPLCPTLVLHNRRIAGVLPLDAPWGSKPVWCYEHHELVGQDALCVRVRSTQLAGRSLLWLPRPVLSAAEMPRAARAMGFFRNRGDRPCDAALSVREGNSFKVVDSWIEKAGVQELLTDFRPCSIKDLLRYLILRFRWYALARLFLRGE